VVRLSVAGLPQHCGQVEAHGHSCYEWVTHPTTPPRPETSPPLADRGRSVTRVGLADAVAPGTAGALWLTTYPSDADPGTAAGMAREVSIAGRQLGPQLRLPAGYLIEQGTDRGLLLAPVALRPGTMADKLWDPAGPQSSRTFEGVIAASTTQIAWAPPCVARCRVQVLNLATGRKVSVELPEASSAANAAFSPRWQFSGGPGGLQADPAPVWPPRR
jgi:hypothetical protein